MESSAFDEIDLGGIGREAPVSFPASGGAGHPFPAAARRWCVSNPKSPIRYRRNSLLSPATRK